MQNDPLEKIIASDKEALAKTRRQSIEKLIQILHTPHLPPEAWGSILTTVEESPAWHLRGSVEQASLAKALLDVTEKAHISREQAVSIGLVIANNMQYFPDALKHTLEKGLGAMRKRFLS